MTELFRKNDRHPEDPRVLIIKDFEDFNLWENRKEYGFKGLLFPKAFSKEECDFISKDIAQTTKQRQMPFQSTLPTIISRALRNRPHYKDIDIPIHEYTPQELKRRSKLSPLTIDTISQCADLFNRLAEKSKYHLDTLHIRTNSDHPVKPHHHGVTVGAIFSGNPTRFIKSEFEFTDQEIKSRHSERLPEEKYVYTVGHGDIIMFEDIWHIAGKLANRKNTTPRTQLII